MLRAAFHIDAVIKGRATEPDLTEEAALFYTFWNNFVVKLVTCFVSYWLVSVAVIEVIQKKTLLSHLQQVNIACGLTVLTVLSISAKYYVRTKGS